MNPQNALQWLDVGKTAAELFLPIISTILALFAHAKSNATAQTVTDHLADHAGTSIATPATDKAGKVIAGAGVVALLVGLMLPSTARAAMPDPLPATIIATLHAGDAQRPCGAYDRLGYDAYSTPKRIVRCVNRAWTTFYSPDITPPTCSDAQVLVYNGGHPICTTLSGDATVNTTGVVTLANTMISGGTWGDSYHVPQVTADLKGRITAITQQQIHTAFDCAGNAYQTLATDSLGTNIACVSVRPAAGTCTPSSGVCTTITVPSSTACTCSDSNATPTACGATLSGGTSLVIHGTDGHVINYVCQF